MQCNLKSLFLNMKQKHTDYIFYKRDLCFPWAADIHVLLQNMMSVIVFTQSGLDPILSQFVHNIHKLFL
jgi:hypothetical protein